MTVATYTRPDYTSQDAASYKANIDAMAKVFERIAGAFAAHVNNVGSPAPDMSIIVDAGAIFVGSVLTEKIAQSVGGFTTPTAGQERIDRVVLDPATGVASRVAGTAVTGSPSATAPSIPPGKVPICQIYFTSSNTSITNSMITDERLPLPSSAPATGPIASGRNIAAKNNTSTPNSKVDFTADELVLKDASGNAVTLSSVSVTGDMAVSGAGGLDTGAEGSSTWYYLWIIYNGVAAAALISASATAPTLPTGYTARALVSAIRNDGSSNFLKFRQAGNRITYEAGVSALAAGTQTVETAVSLTSQIPSIAEEVKLWIRNTVTTNAGAGSNTVSIRLVSGTTFFVLNAQDSAAGGVDYNTLVVDVPNVSQQVYYLNAGGGSVTTLNTDINVLGFKLPMGGE